MRRRRRILTNTFDADSILLRARRTYDEDHVSSWWSKKYGSPSNDVRFLERTEADHAEDFYRDLFGRLDDLVAQHETIRDTQVRFELFKRGVELGKTLGYTDEEVYRKFGRGADLESEAWGEALLQGKMHEGMANEFGKLAELLKKHGL